MSPLAPTPVSMFPREGGGVGRQTPTFRVTPEAPASAGERLDDRATLARAAQGFEAIFVRQMLSAARQAHVGSESLLGGQGMDTFRQMQDDRFADIAAERGAFGLAKMIATQLGRQVGAGETHAQPQPRET